MKKIKENSVELEDYCLPEKTITKEEYCDQIIDTYYNPKHETFTKEEYKKLYDEYISGDKEALEKIRKKSLLLGLEIAKNIYCSNLYSGEFEDIAQDCLMHISKDSYLSTIKCSKGYFSVLNYYTGIQLNSHFSHKEDRINKKNRDIWYEKNNGKIVAYDDSVDELYAGNESVDEIENVVIRKDLSQILQKGLHLCLKPREQEVILGEFFDGKSKTQISREMSVSCERISQIEKNALRRLRLPHISKALSNYLK